MYVKTYGELRIEFHQNDHFCTISTLMNPGNTFTAAAIDVINLLGDIRRDNSLCRGPLQISHDIDGSVYEISHLSRPTSVFLTASQYRQVRDSLRAADAEYTTTTPR